MMRRRAGLSIPKQPLHPNRADVVVSAVPAARLVPTPRHVSGPSSTAPLLSSLLTKRRRSPSPSSPLSPPPRGSPTSFLVEFSSSPIRSAQPSSESWPTWHSPSLPSSSPPPADPLPFPPFALGTSLPSLPITLPAASHVIAHADACDAARPPSQWTLGEIVGHCSDLEKYVRYRPIGYQRLTDTWAVLDERMRKRQYKKPKEPQAAAFAHVRSYTETQLQ